MRKTLPDYFVIFRLAHPINPESYTGIDNLQKFQEFFTDAQMIKTFDMRESSPLGAYLRKTVNDPRFIERPLEVSFDSDVQTTWNGIDYTTGTITGRGEFLYDFWKSDNRILDFEDFVTKGFERNKIVSSNLINLEFLFDDTEATPYTINRYFGLYVSENQLAEFEIEPTVLGAISGQTPIPKSGVDGEPFNLQPFVQTNPNGIRLPAYYYHNDPSGTVNTSSTPGYQGLVNGKFPLPAMVDDPLRIFYVKDRNGVFKRANLLEEINYGNPNTDAFRRVTEIRLFDTQENISDYGGITQMASQADAELLNGGNAQLVLQVSDILNSGVPIAEGEVLEITLKKLNTERRDYYYKLEIVSLVGSLCTFEVTVPDYAVSTTPTLFYTQAVVDLSSP